MKISARNQLKGKISAINKGAVNAQVQVDVNGTSISAIITLASCESMELKVGDEIYAIIKASSVLIASEKPGKISARNVFETKVEKVIKGPVNCELDLTIGSNKLAAIITNEAAEDLGIKEGDSVYAIMKASAMLLAK
jgi:molybdate transport system regulatory protein